MRKRAPAATRALCANLTVARTRKSAYGDDVVVEARIGPQRFGVITANHVGDPRGLEVEVDVLSADAVRLGPGTRVLFERWGGEGLLEGVVRVVEPSGFTKVSALGVEEQRVWVIVAFTSPPARWQRLGDAYRVEARFVLWEAADVLQIPAGSLFRDGGEWAAFVVEDGRAVKRRVKIGQRNGTVAELLDGARAGEQVIAHPDDRLREGVRVETR